MFKHSLLNLSLLLAVATVAQGSEGTQGTRDTEPQITITTPNPSAETQAKQEGITIMPAQLPVNNPLDEMHEKLLSDPRGHQVGSEGSQSYYNRFKGASSKFAGNTQGFLVQGYDATLDKVVRKLYKADTLKDRNGVKALLFVGVSAAAVYTCYQIWKKYFAAQAEENEDELNKSFYCGAACNPRKN